MNSLIKLIRSDLRDFNPYQSARDQAQTGEIWLNANELPWDPSANFSLNNIHLNRYPVSKQPPQLLDRLAQIYQVSAQQILVTRGSSEAIELLLRLFCMPQQDKIMTFPPTFELYALAARLQGIGAVTVPLRLEDGFKLDINQVSRQWEDTVKLIFICSPNNPTGSTVSIDEIGELCEKFAEKSIIVVDEAYIEFSQQQSMVRYLDQWKNLVVLRTLSKAYGLAGARCGVAIGSQALIEWLVKVVAPYLLPSLTIRTVEQALEPEYTKKIDGYIKEICKQREFVMEQLKNIPCVEHIWPSDANFVLVRLHKQQQVFSQCKAKGVIFRDVSQHPSLTDCVRITIGSAEENERLLNVLGRVVNSLG